jgi:WD40 repeat protein
MRRLTASILTVGLVPLFVACGGDNVASPTSGSLTLTPSATPSATASSTPSPAISPSPTTVDQKLIFIRGSTSGASQRGSIWEADVDGLHERQLTPDGTEGTFAGLETRDGATVLYYVSWDGDTDRSLWARNVDTGNQTLVVRYQSPHSGAADAAVAPDGKHAVLGDADGSLYLLDLTTGDRKLVLQGNWQACAQGAGGCYGYYLGAWSPDGLQFMVNKRYWEGGDIMVVDPFADPTKVLLPPSGQFHPSNGEWSGDAASVCAWGRYAEPSGIYAASAPDWRVTNLTPEYEVPSGPRPFTEHWVNGCGWLDPSRIAFVADVVGAPAADMTPYEHHGELSVYDLSSQSSRSLVSVPSQPELSQWLYVFALGDGQRVVWGYVPQASDSPALSNEVVDVTSGERHSILSAGDGSVTGCV